MSEAEQIQQPREGFTLDLVHERPEIRPYTAHGSGVIACAGGGGINHAGQNRGSYVQAELIESYIPQPGIYRGVPLELTIYKRLGWNSRQAIDLRQKWHQRQMSLPQSIILGEN